MHWRSGSRSIAIGGIRLAIALVTGALIATAHAQQMQQVNEGYNALDPQWTLASPFMSAGFGAGSNFAPGSGQQFYSAKVGSGTVGLFAESSDGGASGTPGSLFNHLLASPLQQNWFANLGDPASRTSVFGSYRSNPDTALFNGLYTTASFGVTSLKMNPSGFSGLPNFTGGDAVAMTANAGVGLQLTPQIFVEGSVGVTQVQTSPFR
jgi:hypothetical protein